MSTPTVHVVDGRRGNRFRTLEWSPGGKADRMLLIHHGLGEHAGRYQPFAEQLASSAMQVWSYDCRGHGESGGKKGHADGLEELAADLEFLLPDLIERAGASEVLLYGHSMGAAAVGHYLTTRAPHPAIDAVWLSGIPVRPFLSSLSVRLKARAAPVLARLAPRITLPNGLATDGISSVPQQVQRYLDDPLVHDQISARLGASLLEDAPALLDQAHRIELPIRLWHGADDPISNPEGTKQLFEAIASHDKTMEIFEGARHEVHYDQPETVQRLFRSLKRWLGDHGVPSEPTGDVGVALRGEP
ncbi:MAG: lysophospholipase [Myxococcales bacterium]|nr:lysophospholipase [Myxococcales bacterium]